MIATAILEIIILQSEKSTANSYITNNEEVPSLYALRKDNKSYEDPVHGPPTRPVYGANNANNHKIHFLSQFLRSLIELSTVVCDSTEDHFNMIYECKTTCDISDHIASSMDVISIYSFVDGGI